MKAAKVSELKIELNNRSQSDLVSLCLRLARFKKENKELLTYLLYEADNEAAYTESIKQEIEFDFTQINTDSYYYIKKSVRKILRNCKKYIRYSNEKHTEVELLLYFCRQLKQMHPSYDESTALKNLYDRQIASIKKTLKGLHEDLQYDYQNELDELSN